MQGQMGITCMTDRMPYRVVTPATVAVCTLAELCSVAELKTRNRQRNNVDTENQVRMSMSTWYRNCRVKITRRERLCDDCDSKSWNRNT